MHLLWLTLSILSVLIALIPEARAAAATVFSVEQVYGQMMSDLAARRNEQLAVRRVEKIARGVAGLAAAIGAQVGQEWR
ncbi:hypothetical protein FOL47_002703 [Perkinsus chesapeaki]|uniref:Uncharacterized protein n=1 Tax=Perkinsus chesapeaki TaxID=330153 RepID=A0A7J6MDB8_PERCH|nr:hypothetical protein FOL47_002703 [Perkinsus chesapeaki]